MEHETLPVPYHAQEDPVLYCGPACAQMVIEGVGAGLFGQADLYTDQCHDDRSYWATKPAGLAETLTERSLAILSGFFTLHTLDSEESLSRKLCWTIRNHGKPPIVLVYGWGHWIVLAGYVVSAHPTSAADAAYAIEAFDILDPYPIESLDSTEEANYEQVQYDDWRENYLVPVPALELRGKHVAVCGPDDPGVFPRGSGAQPEAGRDAEPVRSPEEAMQDAIDAMDQDYLRDREPWRSAREGTRPLPPILVERIPPQRGATYLVPFQKDDASGSVPLVVRVNPRTGKYQGAIAIRGGSPQLARMIERERVIEQYTSGNGVEIPGTGRIVFPSPDDLRPNLVWRACQESLSVYWPFYLFEVGDDRIYVRIDGAVIFELHEAIGH